MTHYPIPGWIRCAYDQHPGNGRYLHAVWMFMRGMKVGDTFEVLETPDGFSCPVGMAKEDIPPMTLENAIALAKSFRDSDEMKWPN